MPKVAINPPSLPAPPSFSRAVAVSGPGRTVYVAGIAPLDDQGVAPADMRGQAEACFSKLDAILTSAGGTIADLVSLTIYVTDITQMPAVNEVRARRLCHDPLPATSGMEVAALAHPDWMIEIDGIAFVETDADAG